MRPGRCRIGDRIPRAIGNCCCCRRIRHSRTRRRVRLGCCSSSVAPLLGTVRRPRPRSNRPIGMLKWHAIQTYPHDHRALVNARAIDALTFFDADAWRGLDGWLWHWGRRRCCRFLAAMQALVLGAEVVLVAPAAAIVELTALLFLGVVVPACLVVLAVARFGRLVANVLGCTRSRIRWWRTISWNSRKSAHCVRPCHQ